MGLNGTDTDVSRNHRDQLDRFMKFFSLCKVQRATRRMEVWKTFEVEQLT